MATETTVSKSTVFKVMCECNNYFNRGNIRPESADEIVVFELPSDFIEICENIEQHINKTSKTYSSKRIADVSVSYNTSMLSWQDAFSRELDIYRKARTPRSN